MTDTTTSRPNAPSAFATALTALLPVVEPCCLLDMEPGEVLIHAPGFEDRTLAITKLVKVTGAGSAVLLEYRPHDPKNRLAEVKEALLARGLSVTSGDIIEYNRFEPGDFEDRLQVRLRELGASCVTIDISTMSKLEIMLVLHACHDLQLQVRVFYSEAETYAPTREQFEEARTQNKIHQPTLQIFTGIYGVVRVDSLASVAMQGQPTAALVFMSFNDALTQALLNTVYPSRLFLINGRPPMHTWREEATAWIHDQVRREWEDDNPVETTSEAGVALPARAASTLDYRESTWLLLQLYWQLSTSYRILLAPAGSKCQAVGCYIVKALHPDIHVEYPSPDGFFPNYSTGIGRGWILNLGNLADLVARISTIEKREYLEIPINPSSTSVSA
jgi:hypothetical protein